MKKYIHVNSVPIHRAYASRLVVNNGLHNTPLSTLFINIHGMGRANGRSSRNMTILGAKLAGGIHCAALHCLALLGGCLPPSYSSSSSKKRAMPRVKLVLLSFTSATVRPAR